MLGPPLLTFVVKVMPHGGPVLKEMPQGGALLLGSRYHRERVSHSFFLLSVLSKPIQDHLPAIWCVLVISHFIDTHIYQFHSFFSCL